MSNPSPKQKAQNPSPKLSAKSSSPKIKPASSPKQNLASSSPKLEPLPVDEEPELLPPPASKGMKRVASVSEEAAFTLANIIEDAENLLETDNDSFVVTEREVSRLRKAFQTCVRECETTDDWPDEAREANRLLQQLDTTVAQKDDAQSGDRDEEMTGADNWKILNIPMRRRRQTFIVSLFLFFTALPACTALSIFLLLNPMTFPFMLAYLIYILVAPLRHPLKGRKFWRKGFVLRMYRDYFPVRCVATKEVQSKFDRNKNYLFCYHPHGVHSFGAIVNFGSDLTSRPKLFPGLTFHVQTLKINFYVPFWRHIMTWGGSGDASAECIKKTLASGPGQCVVLVVGGAEESMLASPKTNKLTLLKRKGFIKVALQAGSPLVPCFGFGENDVYGNLADGRPWLQKLVKWSKKKLGFAPLLISGRGYFNYNFGIIPHRRPIVTVVGAPIEVPKIEKPSQEDIDKYHRLYVDALMALYKANKGVYDVMAKSEAQIVS